MRPTTFAVLLILCLGVGCQPSQDQTISLTLTNSLDLNRSASPVVIPITKLPSEGLWAPHTAEGKLIPFQYDDLDGDGKMDELVFLVDIAAKASLSVQLKPVSDAPTFEPRTHLRLGQKSESGITPIPQAARLQTWDNKITQAQYQFEGPGWENELVAFRNYLDMRNGMDIFGKTQPQLCLDKVGADGAHNYHELDDWGMDILKVGSSLGAGSVAFWYRDSLIRLTSEEADYQAISEGPVRSTFALNFKGVALGDKQIDATHTISIYGGSFAYQASVTLSDPVGIQVVPGIVDLHELPAHSLSAANSTSLYTYGFQSENKDSLGMALLVSQELNPQAVDTDTLAGEIPNTYGLTLSPQGASYRFYAGWQPSSSDFASEATFKAFLEAEMEKFSAPLQIEWL